MVSNPGYYSQMATAGSLTQIEDGVDNPHTGLIKALSLGVAGNYVISGFDATSVTATSATIAAGVVFRDGETVAISGSGVSLSTTYTTGYHLLVARSSALAVINPAAANKVPAFTAGDVPIAILAHTGSNPMQIQYFGTGKTKNSLSLAYSNSGTYTEMSKVTAASGGTTIEVGTAGGDFTIDNTDADKKIVMRLGSDDANTDFEIRNNSDAVKFGVDGAGTTTIAGTLNLGSVVAAGTDTDKFLVLDSGGNVDFRAGSDVASDIGALTAEADTLNTVTGRGATTSNNITVGNATVNTITSTVNQNLSYEVISNSAPPITGTKTVVYAHDLSAAGNTAALPAPSNGNILYIKNIFTNPITITGTPLINMGDTTHPKITAANVITLAPFEHVTLQATDDTTSPLVVGHMIISD